MVGEPGEADMRFLGRERGGGGGEGGGGNEEMGGGGIERDVINLSEV